jgi:DNA-binding Lrp family transcriptional regulator
MVVKAFVLIETAVGKTKDVYKALSKLDMVKSIDTVTGPYDIIATIEGADTDSIGNIIATDIHVVPDILRTVSCLSIKLK